MIVRVTPKQSKMVKSLAKKFRKSEAQIIRDFIDNNGLISSYK